MSTESIESIVDSPEATNAELAKSTDISEYVAERTEQNEAERPVGGDEVDALAREVRDTDPSLKEAKKLSRYERLKRSRDAKQQRIDELEQKYERGPEREVYAEGDGPEPQRSDTPAPVDTAPLERSLESARHIHGDGFDKAYEAFVEYAHKTRDKAAYDRIMQSADPGAELVQWWNEQGNPSPSPEAYEAAIQQGRQEQDFQQQLAERDQQIRAQAELDLRIENFAAQNPDFHKAIDEASFMYEGVNAPVFNDLVRRSPLAAEILYVMAKDVFSDNSLGILEKVGSTANDPIAQARLVGALEQVIYVSRNGGSAPMPRATKAPPPLRPVRGGANAPRDIHALAKSDDASDYISARRRSAS